MLVHAATNWPPMNQATHHQKPFEYDDPDDDKFEIHGADLKMHKPLFHTLLIRVILSYQVISFQMI